jgi:allophanate hydrolase
MMADGPTTGGYPKIATVVTADLPLLAQALPGQGRVRFAAVEVEEAQRALPDL